MTTGPENSMPSRRDMIGLIARAFVSATLPMDKLIARGHQLLSEHSASAIPELLEILEKTFGRQELSFGSFVSSYAHQLHLHSPSEFVNAWSADEILGKSTASQIYTEFLANPIIARLNANRTTESIADFNKLALKLLEQEQQQLVLANEIVAKIKNSPDFVPYKFQILADGKINFKHLPNQPQFQIMRAELAIGSDNPNRGSQLLTSYEQHFANGTMRQFITDNNLSVSERDKVLKSLGQNYQPNPGDEFSVAEFSRELRDEIKRAGCVITRHATPELYMYSLKLPEAAKDTAINSDFGIEPEPHNIQVIASYIEPKTRTVFYNPERYPLPGTTKETRTNKIFIVEPGSDLDQLFTEHTQAI